MGRKRKMSKELTIRKTNGWTVVDEDLVLTLQMVNVTEAQRYISYWHRDSVKDIDRAKKKGLVAWDKRGKGYSKNTVAFAGLRLTEKGLKMLTAGGGTFIAPRGT